MRLRFCDLEDILKYKLFEQIEINIGDETLILNDGDNRFDTLTWSPPKSIWRGIEILHGIEENIEEINILKDYFLSNIEGEGELPIHIHKILKKYKPHTEHKGVGLGKGMSFYTIVPHKRLPFNEVEVLKFQQFLEYFFQTKKKLFKKVHYCIEAGKHKKNPNLHSHFLIWFREDGGKNFARDLKSEWNKFYEPKYNISYNEVIEKNGYKRRNKGIDRVPCNTQNIINDKIDYMTNSLKGSHENFIDLNINKIHDFESSTSQ